MTLTQFQSKIDAICSCMEQESREQMVERLYQEQVQPLQGNTDFDFTVSACANTIHASFGGVTSKRELIEEVLRKYFSPPVATNCSVSDQLTAAAKSVAENIYNFVTQNTWDGWTKEQCEQIIIKHFQPLVQRLEQVEKLLKNSGELFVEFHNLARPSCHSNPTLAIKHALTEYKSLLAKVQSLEQQLKQVQSRGSPEIKQRLDRSDREPVEGKDFPL